MINQGAKVALLVTCLMMTACSSLKIQMQTKAKAIESDVNAIKPTKSFEVDTLYDLLSAEIAVNKQQLDYSLERYLIQMRKTEDVEVVKRALQLAQAMSRQQETLEAAEKWFKLEPNNLGMHHTLASYQMMLENMNQTFYHIDFLLQNGYTDFLDPLISQVKRQSTDTQKALLSHFSVLLKKMPKHAELWFARGSLELLLEHHEAALISTNKTLRFKKNVMAARFRKAQLLHILDQDKKAIKVLNTLLKDQPNYKTAAVFYVQLLMKNELFEKARQKLVQLYAAFPDDENILLSYALVQFRLEQYDEAIALFLLLKENTYLHDSVCYYLGIIHQTKQNNEEAVKYYQQVIDGRYFLMAHKTAADLLQDVKGLAVARQYLQALRESLSYRQEEILTLESELLIKHNKKEEALMLLNEALTYEDLSDRLSLLYQRGLLSEALGDDQQFITDLNEVLTEQPNSVEALNALAYHYANRNIQLKKGLELIKKALKLSPNTPALMDTLAWLYFKLGKLDQSLAILIDTYEVLPDPEVAAHLGEVLWQLGKHKHAKNIWRKALQNKADSLFILEMINRLKVSL